LNNSKKEKANKNKLHENWRKKGPIQNEPSEKMCHIKKGYNKTCRAKWSLKKDVLPLQYPCSNLIDKVLLSPWPNHATSGHQNRMLRGSPPPALGGF